MNSHPKKNKGKALINNGIRKLMETRNKDLESKPIVSRGFQEQVQPAFKFHMEALNPPLPLGEGTQRILDRKGSVKERHRMDELESVTTRENDSVAADINDQTNFETNNASYRRHTTTDSYNKMKPMSGKRKGLILPVHYYEEAILKDIDANQTLVIQGTTGCGKSTQIPQFILDQASRRDEPVHIVITQPRRIAAISLAHHVASERGWEVGSYVGYQVGLDRKGSRETVINYVTTGVLLESLIHNKTLADYTHIILDEVHERDVDMDLLLSVVKELLMHDHKTKLILMSATVVAEKFSCYFSKEFDQSAQQCLPGPIFRIGGKMFPMEEFFLNDFPKLGICQEAPMFENITTTPRLTAELKEIIYQLLLYITQMEIDESINKNLNSLDMGSVLIFLPGLGEITELNEYLMMGPKRDDCINPRRRDIFASRHRYQPIFPLSIQPNSPIAEVLRNKRLQQEYQNTFYLLALHSSIGLGDQRRAFDSPQLGRRKIILSTNIAESSITVKDIQYVFDLCMIKRLRYDRETHFSTLSTEWTSKSSCRQRSGRAGRVRHGQVYRLISNEVFEELDEYCPPEILTGPLTQVILRIKEFGREPRMLLQRAMDCPTLEDIGYTFLTLKEAGALCIKRHELCKTVIDNNGEETKLTQIVMPIDDHWQGDLTFIGRLISSLPMDLHMGKLIALGYAFDVLEESIIIAACLSVSRSVFLQPLVQGSVKREGRNTISPNQTRVLDAFEKKLRLSEGKCSDLLTMLHAFKLWYQRTKTGAFKTRADERRWCEDLFLDYQALREVEILIDEVKRRLKERFNIMVSDFENIDKKNSKENDNDVFLCPNDNNMENTVMSEGFRKSFRNILLQIAIAGAFYPNYFLRTHNPFCEDDAMRTFDGINPFQCVEIGNLPMDEGNLYRHSIASHFQRFCMKYSRDTPTVICRNTKAIVKFPSDESNTLRGGQHDGNSYATNLSVVLALKLGLMSGLKPKITTYELTNEEKTHVKKLVDSDHIRNNQILPLNYKYVSGHKNFIGFPNTESNFIKVYVTFTVDCGVFYGLYEDERHREKSLFEEIYNYTTDNNRKKIQINSLQVKDIILAPYEGEYYRAEVISIAGAHSITVFFVDYGNVAVVSQRDIEGITDHIRNFCPFLAVKFSLSEIKPLAASHPDGKWASHEKNKFTEYVMDYMDSPLAIHVYSVVENTVRGRVELLNHGGKILNEELICLGIAERCEETYLSRQDNVKRIRANNERQIDLFGGDRNAQRNNKGGYKSLSSKFIKQCQILDDNDSHSSENLDDDEDDEYVLDLYEREMGATDSKSNENNGDKDSQTMQYQKIMTKIISRQAKEDVITLSSPHHPFLMKFHGLAESCRRPVSIATESVNSIIIEPEPQNHLTRLLTAACVQSHHSGGSVGLADTSTDLVLRYTTLMPYIPGLPFIISLIFTPYAELISDKNRTRYIGARCGLGYDSEGRPLHPSNDLEIKTDVRFIDTDLRQINGIRSLLNLSLGNTAHSQDVLEKYQFGIKKFLSTLFSCSRDIVNNEGIEEYTVPSILKEYNSGGYRNLKKFIANTDINRIFINHVTIEGICRRHEWLRVPVLSDPRTERRKNDWVRRFVAATEENLEELSTPQSLMARVKLSRDVLPYVRICELCTNPSAPNTKGVPLYTETDMDQHLLSSQHRHNVNQFRNILNI